MPLTPQITLNATLQDISGNPAGSPANPAIMRIALAGFGLTLPCIAGTSSLVRVGPKDYLDTGSGAAANLWGNDAISPAGTYYAITLLDGDGNILQCGAYRFSGTGTINLSSAQQITPTNSLAYSPCSGAVPGTVYTAPGVIVTLFKNPAASPSAGTALRPGIDYTLSSQGTVATLTTPTISGDSIYALVAIQSSSALVPGAWQLSWQQCGGAVPGTAYVAPSPAAAVAKNGALLRPILDYTLSANGLNITLAHATSGGDTIYALCAEVPTMGSIGAEIDASSPQSIANTTDTVALLPNVVKDPYGFVGPHANALTVPPGIAGWYTITATVRWASNNTGERDIWLLKNGAFTPGPIGTSAINNGSGTPSEQAVYSTYLNVGDYIQIDVFQTSGGALNLLSATLSLKQ